VTLDKDMLPSSSIRPRGDAGSAPPSSVNARTCTLGRRVEDRPRREFAGVSVQGQEDYSLMRLLGEGGMGSVYLAHQASLDRNVALKMVRPEVAGDAHTREKFLSEAAVTGALEHPYIVPVHELGQDSEGAVFLAMKRITGKSWSDQIAALSLERNLEVLMRVCDATAFAHAHGVIHRDLKPANVMLGDYGEVYVVDWGLAARVPGVAPEDDVARKAPTLQPGAAAGTPSYMSPEMAVGDVQAMGPASDIYLLGAILYEVLAGKPPHPGNTALLCLARAAKNVIEETEVRGELMDVAQRAMATRPEDRYPTVQAFQDALRTWREHAESQHLVERARAQLVEAEATQGYEDFAQALFRLQEALTIWNGNAVARQELVACRLAYAECAWARENLDLAESVLLPGCADHEPMRARIQARRAAEADARRCQQRRRFVLGLRLLLLVLVLGVLGLQRLQQIVQQRQNRGAGRWQAMGRLRTAASPTGHVRKGADR